MRITFFILCVFTSLYYFSQQKDTKLVVGIIVDQMRDEYLDRFYNDFSEDGFKKLISEGYRLKNLHFNYMPTFTAPGHSSVYTGTTPSFHGIVGNDWYNKQKREKMYCTDDTCAKPLGLPKETKEGNMSPINLKSSTITDELKLSTNMRAKVIGMSIKDRGAILPAGHLADWAFWMSDNGNFISSTYYDKKLPNWVEKFNKNNYVKKYLYKNWDLLKDKSVYDESLPDKNIYEKFKYDIEAVFPYNLKKLYDEGHKDIIKSTPYGNSILKDLAIEAIEAEELGKDEFTDFLTISFSSTDYIGHVLGPRSMELQDTYLRLDLDIAELIKYLDTKVGKDNYILFLTADHACSENANHLKDMKYDVISIHWEEMEKIVDSVALQLFGSDIIEKYYSYNIFFDLEKMKSLNINLDDACVKLSNELEKNKYVKQVFTEEEIMETSNNFILNMIANGYDPKQNGQLVLLYEPGVMEYYPTGTTHGTPYMYDTHVPGLFYGKGIKKGLSYNKHYITEIAPTISHKLHITLPNSTKGDLIYELMD